MSKVLMMPQGCLEWELARLGKVTGSRIKGALQTKTTQGYKTMKAEIIAERLTNSAKSFTAAATEWGHRHEPQARQEHALIHSWPIEEVGFVELNENMGCSPDGLINDDGMVQYKCPKNSDVHINTLLTQEVPKEYVPQLQWELFTTGRQWTEFVSFDKRMPEELRLCVLHVEVDPEFQATMVKAVSAFLDDVDKDINQLQEIVNEIREGSISRSEGSMGVNAT